jgi:hypothetical protein
MRHPENRVIIPTLILPGVLANIIVKKMKLVVDFLVDLLDNN